MLPFNFFGGGNRFPYTNFHALNLDWIIDKVKELFGRTEQVERDVQSCTQYIDNVDSEIQNKINNEIPSAVQQAIQAGLFNDVLTASRTRRVLIVGDSYGAGWTPDGDVTGFPILVKNMMHLSDANFFTVNKGGARFGAASGSEYAFDEVLSGYLSNITNKETITDIVFAGGYNEGSSSYESIREGIQRCKSVIGTNFTNPSLKVYLFAVGYHTTNPAQRMTLWRRYKECYAKSGWAYTKLTPAICYADWWASDGYHPKADAQNAIATQIVNILEGGTMTSTCVVEEYANVSMGGNARWYTFMDTDNFDSFLFGMNINFDNAQTLNRTTAIKLFDITSNLPLCNIADASLRQKYEITCLVQTGGSHYETHTLTIYLEQTARKTFAVMANIFEATPAGNNYLEITNVTGIQIISGGLHIKTPYQF